MTKERKERERKRCSFMQTKINEFRSTFVCGIHTLWVGSAAFWFIFSPRNLPERAAFVLLEPKDLKRPIYSVVWHYLILHLSCWVFSAVGPPMWSFSFTSFPQLGYMLCSILVVGLKRVWPVAAFAVVKEWTTATIFGRALERNKNSRKWVN
jgi:hypothetical protein